MARRGENIFKRKDGRWEARYIHHYENGKAKYRYLYGSSYKEVKQKKLEEQQKGKEEAASEHPMSEFSAVALCWLADIKLSVKESTYTRYHRIVTRYLVPTVGNESLHAMDTRRFIGLQKELTERGGKEGSPLAQKTVSDILCVAKAILRYGRELGYLCPEIGKIKCIKRRKREISIFPEEKRLRLEHTLLRADDRDSIGILITLFTGIRIGELCGLRWGDIDFDSGIITVRRTVERISDLDPSTPGKTKVIVSEPKTENAERNIPLPSFLLERLEVCCQSKEYYILTGTANYTEPHQVYIRYQKYLKRNGYGEYTFHALRHTFATRCVELGFDIKTLSEILGHANISTTLAIYVHPSVQQKKAQMERLTPVNIS